MEPWWNPGGTLPQGRPGPPRSLSGLRPQSFQLLGKRNQRGTLRHTEIHKTRMARELKQPKTTSGPSSETKHRFILPQLGGARPLGVVKPNTSAKSARSKKPHARTIMSRTVHQRGNPTSFHATKTYNSTFHTKKNTKNSTFPIAPIFVSPDFLFEVQWSAPAGLSWSNLARENEKHDVRVLAKGRTETGWR